MIAHLIGKNIKKTDRGIILSTGNVGYFIHLNKKVNSTTEEGKEYQFFIHTQVREDAFDLYGFGEYEELLFFRNLISINGIGPKVALEILNAPTEKVKQAIIDSDVDFIKKIPGIGPKTAKRIILELKSKVEISELEQIAESSDQEAVEALIGLGYQRKHINQALSKLPEQIIKTEDIITYFLKNA